jgi:hypothetical protein
MPKKVVEIKIRITEDGAVTIRAMRSTVSIFASIGSIGEFSAICKEHAVYFTIDSEPHDTTEPEIAFTVRNWNDLSAQARRALQRWLVRHSRKAISTITQRLPRPENVPRGAK